MPLYLFICRCVSLRCVAYRCIVVVLSLPCPCQGDVEYAFEQLDSGSFVANVSVAALDRPIAGYPELKKAGRSGNGWPGGQQLEQQALEKAHTNPDGSYVTYCHIRFVAFCGSHEPFKIAR
jgi:hypothetical protein